MVRALCLQVACALLLTAALPNFAHAQRPFSPLLAQEVFRLTWEHVRDHYADPGYNGVDWEAVRQEFEPRVRAAQTAEAFYALMAQMIARLGDDHSAFLPPTAARMMQNQRVGAAGPPIFGIAANLRRMPDRSLLVLQVLPGTQAELLLNRGDRITAIDRVPLALEDLTARLYGDRGDVQLTVHSPDGVREVIAPREAFTTAQFPSPVLAQILPSGAGYVAVFDFFSFSTAVELREALRRLMREHQPGGLILDLRANDGGIIVQALEALSLFLDGGAAGAHVDRAGNATTYTLPSGRVLPEVANVPLVVLVGQNTNSAGELFAAVMQARRRAVIVGVNTPGNVEMARDFRLPDGSMLWLAVGRYRDPAGNLLEGRGVVPDRVVPAAWWQHRPEDDPQVRSAVEVLRAQGARLRPPSPRAEPAAAPLAPLFNETPLQPGQAQATFDALWDALQAHHPDGAARRAAWEALRARFAPRLSQVRHAGELDALMHELLQALGLSYAGSDVAEVLRAAERGRESPLPTIGAAVRLQADGAGFVVAVAPGSPAASAGLRAGDLVVRVNDQPLPPHPLWLRHGMPGPEGWLSLTVRSQEGLTRTVRLRRAARAPLPASVAARYARETRSAHLTVAHFRAPDTASRVRDALSNLSRQGAIEHIVLDVRHAEGGHVVQVLNVLALFVDGGSAGELTGASSAPAPLLIPRGRTLPAARQAAITVLLEEETHALGTILGEVLRAHRGAQVLGEGGRVLSVAHDLPNGARVWLPAQRYTPPAVR